MSRQRNNGSLVDHSSVAFESSRTQTRLLCIGCNENHEDGSTCQEYFNRMGNIEHREGENRLDEMILAQYGMAPL